MNKKVLIFFLLAIAIVGGIIFFMTAKHKSAHILNVGIATWPGFAPGYVAKEKGFFDGLDVQFYIIDDFTARQASFKSNKTQATIVTIDSYAFDEGNDIDGKLIMMLDRSNGADGIVVKQEINNISDLVGKKVAYTRGSPSHFFLIHLLKEYGLSKDSIQSIEVDDPGKAAEAFISGSVDAAVTWEPNISQIISSGKGKLLASTKTVPNLIVDAMEVNTDAYNNRKEDLQKFVTGWLKAVDYIKTDQKDAYSIMAKKLHIAENDFPIMADGLIYMDKQMNRDIMLPEDNSIARKLFDEATRIWSEEKLIKRTKESSGLITSEFISE
jgi:NitT/TauT family transport system substrate-binding protein